MKFLLVEDDKVLASAIEQLLAEHHYVMDLATDGVAGREMADAFSYDLILLDWMLPQLDGMKLCKHLRNEGNDTPIILMTARDASTDKVAGLDAGADDYLVKPFEFEELLARIRALLRRSEGIVSPILQWGDLSLDPCSSEVTCQGIPVAITPKEYALLELFLRNPSRIFSLDNLLDKVWPFEDSPSVGSVRTHIKGLRQKLKKAGVSDMIATVYGLGYRLKSVSGHTTPPGGVATASDAVAGEERKLDLASLWQAISPAYLQRVETMANSLQGLQTGPISPAIRQQALAEAHTLAGSLGSFGFRSATALCRELESILSANADLSAAHVHRLETVVTQIQQTLEQGLGETSATAVEVAPGEPGLPLASIPTTASGKRLPGQPFQLLLVENRAHSADQTLGDRNQNWLQTFAATAPHCQIQVSVVASIAQARSVIFPQQGAVEPPHIVVFDFDGSHDLPDNNSAEFQLLREMQALQPPIPTLVLTAADSFENRVRVARRGVSGLLQMPTSPLEILETALRVLQKGAPPTAKLLIVDDDPVMLALLQSLLRPWGFQLQLLSDPQQFWQTLERVEPDLVLLDVKMPQIDGFDLCQVLRSASRWHDLPVLFMSAYTDAETIQRVFSAGADDYIRKPIVAPELVARVLGWLERSRIRRFKADIDNLTGVSNRRKSTQSLNRLMKLAQRQDQTLCFALIDFDHFKQINDKYGHPAGDRVLKRFGEHLQSTFRSEDVVGRWGGEEFVIGLYGVSCEEGTYRLQQLLQSWQQEQFEVETEPPLASQDTPPFQITFTAGVAVYPQDATDLQALYRAADEALYRAKAAGRNRIGISNIR